jgi:hypothetical protein
VETAPRVDTSASYCVRVLVVAFLALLAVSYSLPSSHAIAGKGKWVGNFDAAAPNQLVILVQGLRSDVEVQLEVSHGWEGDESSFLGHTPWEI